MFAEDLTSALDQAIHTALMSLSSWHQFMSAIGRIPRVVLDFTNPLAWPYLVSNVVLAWILYQAAKRGRRTSAATFREFAFPAERYLHSSTRLDCRFAVIDLAFNIVLYVPIMTAIGVLGANVMSMVLMQGLGWEPPRTLSPAGLIAAAAAFLALHDFLNYWIHVMFHKVPVLWAFHQVHHSAEVLTPATAFRVHPVEIIGFAALQAPVVGLSAVFYQNIIGPDRQIAMIFGVSMLGFLLGIFGNHLRHSHIWFSYGAWLNRIVMSPVHHQLHHSIEARHLDKNFGVKLSIWDAMFGTLYRPGRPETFRVGLPDRGTEFTTIGQLYGLPFLTAGRLIKTRARNCVAGMILLPREGR